MKNKILLLLLGIPVQLLAQVHIESTPITIQQFSVFTIDSLVLLPGLDLTIQNTEISHKYISVPLPFGTTIKAVYTFSTPINFTGFITLKYSPDDLAGHTEPTLKLVSRADASPGVWLATGGSAVDLTYKTITENFYNTNFYELSATSANTALPIHLLHFSAQKFVRPNHALLEWEVAKDDNAVLFELERSADGRQFEKITSMVASSARAYSFNDDQVLPGANYYRLVMYNPSMSRQTSTVRFLQFEPDDVPSQVFPNPLTAESKLVVKNETLNNTQARVFDAAGKLVASFRIATGFTAIDASQWLPGLYLFVLENGEQFKLEKQK